MIDIAKIVDEKLSDRYPKILKKSFAFILSKILYLKKINDFISNNSDKRGLEFIDEVFNYLNFDYTLSERDFNKIPSEGKLIIVANHPLGGLDGLSLIKLLSKVRNDVKVVANSYLLNIEQLSEFFIPFTLDSTNLQKSNIEKILNHLNNNGALIFFPAGEVSRLKGLTVVDGKWHKGAIFFSKKTGADILPIYVKAKNSPLFYAVGVLSKFLSMLLLPSQLFYQKNKTISIKVGNYIPAKNIETFDSNYAIKLLKKHTYRIGKGRNGIFKTENNIIHPVNVKLIVDELKKSTVLFSKDKKTVFCVNYKEAPNVINEIARLREHTFRLVGEGTGKKKDMDEYDKHYDHIVLWDDDSLEIIGAYRLYHSLGKNVNKYYTSSLFEFSDKLIGLLPNSIELGRSFIQKKYWNTYALEYIWKGIGKYILMKENVRFLFGVVSLSNTFPNDAKKMIVYFYDKWYGDDYGVKSKNPYILSIKDRDELSKILYEDDIKKDYLILKKYLKGFGVAIPTLYKNYSELCEREGIKFLAYGVDEDFGNCIDSFIMLDLNYMKEEKKERYFI
jgi:putative hemolysin